MAEKSKLTPVMQQYVDIKDENPEINTAIIEAANNTDLDPKAVALGAYMTYLLLELAMKEDDALISFNE